MHGTLILIITFALLSAAAPLQGAEPAQDPELAKRLEAIDQRGSKIQDFTATFRQDKFTALLRKPLLSTGTVRVKGSSVRWDTEKPEPVVLFSDGKEFRMYYPQQKALEIYPIDGRLSDLAASPLPRLQTLREHFTIQEIPAKELAGKGRDTTNLIALELTPKDESLAEHIDAVRVLLDAGAAHIITVETLDADGDRTLITFDGVRLNTGLEERELALTVPQGTKVSRPLEGAAAGGSADEDSGKARSGDDQ